MGSISNCGWNERQSTSGGQPGDQNKKEYALVSWYSRPWSCILRPPNKAIAKKLSAIATASALNNNIGYDQPRRHTFLQELSKVGYDPAKIKTPCEADCSSSTSSCIIATGHQLGEVKLANLGLQTSSTIRSTLTKLGWECFTSSDYTRSSAKLQPGDVMVAEGSHVAIWVSANVSDTSSSGSSGEDKLPGAPSGAEGGGAGQVSSLGIGGYTYEDYSVKPGDTIDSIAKKFRCTPALIIFINNLKSDVVTPGMRLKIPRASGVLENPSAGTNPVTKKHTVGIDVSKPTIECIFYTEIGRLATVSTTGLTSATDLDNDIITVTTTRNMGQDCPTFTMNLTWRRGWYYALSSNDLVIIKMQRPPEKRQTVFIGLIDDIRKTIDFSSGQPQRAVQVTGRGYNKALVNLDVGLIENISIDTQTGFFAGFTEMVSLDSFDAINVIINNYIDRAVRYQFQDGSKYGDRFQYVGNHHDGEVLTDFESYTQYNGSLWNFIKEMTNAPWNETYWEIQDEKATLIHRRTPFNKEDWIALPRTVIPDKDLVSDSTGRSDLETYTLFSVHPTIGGETLANVFMPLWYPPFVHKYGITSLTATTTYQSWGTISEGEISGDATGELDGDFDDNVNVRKNIIFHPSGKNTMKHIVLHTSCAPGLSAERIARVVQNQGLSVHGVIDDVGVMQTAEFDALCRHCGNGNQYSFGFEQTEHKAIKWNKNATKCTWDDKDQSAIKSYHDKLYANAVALFASLCKKYHISPNDILSHKEIAKKYGGSDHGDPEELWDVFRTKFGDNKWTMNAFRNNVRKAMNKKTNLGSGWKTTKATCYGNTSSDDNGINGWNGYNYHSKKGCMVAIPIYFIRGTKQYNPKAIQQDCPELANGYGSIIEIVNPENGKKCRAIVADCGNFGPHAKYNHNTLLDLQPNTQRALGINGNTTTVKFRVIGHWNKDKTNGNGPYNP